MRTTTLGIFFSATCLLVAAACSSKDTAAPASTSTGTATTSGGGGMTSTTGTGGTTSSAGGATSGGGGAVAQTCDAYCALITKNCTDMNAQYSSNDACVKSCAAFPPGMAADMAGNTLGCRIYHAGAAAADAGTHCVHAGPGGAGLCGANCDGFCTIAAKACTATNKQFADDTACQTACKGFKDMVKYNSTVTTGNSLACRLYHLTVATTDPGTHCPHIVANSPVCM